MKISNLLRSAMLAAGLGSLLLSAACAYEVATPCNVDTSKVTYSDISRIVQNNCLKCHSAKDNGTQGGGHNWEDFNEFQQRALDGTLTKVVEQQDKSYQAIYMPRGAQKLSACDIERIKAWVAAGAPQN